MIIQKDLQEKLTQEVVGKEFSTWGTDFDVLKVVREMLLAEVGLQAVDLSSRRDGQTISITYKEYALFYVKVSKQKGERHYSCFGVRHYDWVVKSVEVSLYAETVEDRIAQINKEVIAANKAREATDEQALELLKYVMEKYSKDAYDAARLCKYVYDHDYILKKKIEAQI